ncbi:hypothetical protein P170DRAFT_270920 [Aspergillus steynii IBT 23096]|uniref:Uncharacterized protein n=1 Tax=Aspergillus steynii IBT 23096 TaxID=1392250 RepID=A0A2I2FWF6_9EURO|nr:uncharacterized protein P170DRAFT_270920 [Aspergillus steynii IBT 23096]PLB44972.1 hypothetical protein P170DRAFT_270920 [Aspergillus steynii IBT 23096]
MTPALSHHSRSSLACYEPATGSGILGYARGCQMASSRFLRINPLERPVPSFRLPSEPGFISFLSGLISRVVLAVGFILQIYVRSSRPLLLCLASPFRPFFFRVPPCVTPPYDAEFLLFLTSLFSAPLLPYALSIGPYFVAKNNPRTAEALGPAVYGTRRRSHQLNSSFHTPRLASWFRPVMSFLGLHAWAIWVIRVNRRRLRPTATWSEVESRRGINHRGFIFINEI